MNDGPQAAAAKRSAPRRPAKPVLPIDMGVLPLLMGYMLRRGHQRVIQDFHQTLKDETIRPAQFSILEIIGCNPGIRPSDISQALAISRANLAPLLAELTALGFVSRRGDKTDGRAQAMLLTRAGVARLARLHDLVLPHEDRLATALPGQGRAALLALLQALISGNGG